MSNARVFALLMLPLASACQAERSLEAPPLDRAKSVVLALEGTDVTLVAADLSPPGADDFRANALLLDSSADDELWAILYSEPLADLGLPPGQLQPVDPGTPGAGPLPLADAIFTKSADLDTGWRSAPALSSALRALRFASVGAPACASAGGCLAADVDLDPSEQFRCERPCAAGAEPDAPEAPSPPAAPVLAPCPAGWTASGEPARCEPPPAVSCGPGEAQLLGDAACAPLGGACPAGDWADDLPADRPVVYVKPNSNGTTGSRTSPFGTIAVARTLAMPGSVLALARGEYEEDLLVDRDLLLVGACEQATVIRAGTRRRLIARNDGGSIRGARIEGHTLTIEEGASLDLTAARLVGSPIDVRARASLAARRIVLSDARVRVFAGGAIELEEAVLETAALSVSGAEATIRSTLFRVRGSTVAVHSEGGALTIDSSVIESGSGRALELLDAATATATALLVRGGAGILASSGSRLVLRRSALVSTTNGVTAGDPSDSRDDGTVVDAEDLVLTGALRAFGVDDGAFLRAKRVSIERQPRRTCGTHPLGCLAIASWGPESRSEVTDLEARGASVTIEEGSAIDLTRASIEGGWVQIIGDASARVADLAIQSGALDVRGHATVVLERARVEDGVGGPVEVRLGPGLEVLRSAAIRVVGEGVSTTTPASLEATDVEIRDGADAGISAQLEGAKVAVERGVIAGIRGRGVEAWHGARARFQNITVQSTRSSTTGAGVGAWAQADGHLEIDRFLVTGSERTGLRVETSSLIDATNGVVSDSPIGAEILDPSFDPRRVMRGVVYRSISGAAIAR